MDCPALLRFRPPEQMVRLGWRYHHPRRPVCLPLDCTRKYSLTLSFRYIRLTSDRQNQNGYLWSRLPLTATNWEIELEFKIHGKGNLFGDGMAMWITKQRAQAGPVFGSIDRFEGLGIFFDTYKNNRPGVIFPYVMAMLGDGQKAYNHGNDGKDQELAGCSVCLQEIGKEAC